MRKPLVTRILGLAALYCAVFVILVVIQFSNQGNFTLPIGTMTVRGQYPESDEQTEDGRQNLIGGARIFFGGLEFNLKDDNSPDYLIQGEDSVSFGLPNGTILVFSTFASARGPELRIGAEFAEDITEVTIPITQRRSSLQRDSGQLSISYNGERYLFSRPNRELEDGKLILSEENTVVSYRSMGKQKDFDPSDFVIAQAFIQRDYEAAVNQWRDHSFNFWSQNSSDLQDEVDVTAYLGESLRQGKFAPSIASIPRNFMNGSRRTHQSSVYLGSMAAAYRSFTAAEREKSESISRLIRDESMDILKEEHILDYLLSRNNDAIANNALELIRNIDPETLTPWHLPGLLEAWSDFSRWHLPGDNPAERFIDTIIQFTTEHIQRDPEKDLVFVPPAGERDTEFSLRLGKALAAWAEGTGNTDWAAVGRSLVLSALTSGGIGSAELYRILSPGDYYPRATKLPIGSLWAWTASPSVSAANVGVDVDITVSFPENTTHFMMIRGVRPFVKLQIHGIDFRSDSQFERYDSSGWVYYQQDQVLVVKLKHRAPSETVRIVYRVERPPVVVVPEPAVTNEP